MIVVNALEHMSDGIRGFARLAAKEPQGIYPSSLKHVNVGKPDVSRHAFCYLARNARCFRVNGSLGRLQPPRRA